MRDTTNRPQMDPFVMSHCEDAREHQNHTLLGMGLVFRGWGRDGGFKTCQTCHIGMFDVSWKGRKVLFGDGFVVTRMREG